MSRREKLLERLRRRPPEADFDDVRWLLVDCGFEQVNVDWSHFMFRHPDGRKIAVPTVQGRRVKKWYIVRVLELLDLAEGDGDEHEET